MWLEPPRLSACGELGVHAGRCSGSGSRLPLRGLAPALLLCLVTFLDQICPRVCCSVCPLTGGRSLPGPGAVDPPEPASRTGRRHLPAAQPRPAAPRPRGLSRRHCSPHSASLPAASGRQLQPEEPDAESEEECSVSEAPRPPPSLGRAYTAQGDLAPFSRQVTEGPVDEIIRPRPQGSSPVYECAAEGPGFGLPVSLLDRGPQAEGRLALGLQAAGSPPASPCVATRPALLASGHSCAP